MKSAIYHKQNNMETLEYLDITGASEIISYFKNNIHTLKEDLQSQIDTILVGGVPAIGPLSIDALFIKNNEIFTYGNVSINDDKIFTL